MLAEGGIKLEGVVLFFDRMEGNFFLGLLCFRFFMYKVSNV